MKKNKKKQEIEPRKPQQARAREKVELILEAAIRLLEKGGVSALTTNAIAETAGVSIGTLYQYFSNKEAILDGLADREISAMAARIRKVMTDASLATPEKRVSGVVAAVAASYGNRRGAHRLVMAHSLAGSSSRMSPLLADLVSNLDGQRATGTVRGPLQKVDAFVLIHAIAGVLRAMTSQTDAPPRIQIEAALTRLVSEFVR